MRHVVTVRDATAVRPTSGHLGLPELVVHNPCRRCGECCKRMSRPPFQPKGEEDGGRVVNGWLIDVKEDLPANVLADYQKHMAGLFSGKVSDAAWSAQPCFWLDQVTMFCKHYEHRPQICRDYVCEEAAARVENRNDARADRNHCTAHSRGHLEKENPL